ncbi:MAG: flavin prenyltransferase UbiX [Zavarzinella sp.]
MRDDLVVAITGASGSIYGIRLLEVLLNAGKTVHLVLSPAATEVIDREVGLKINLKAFDVQTIFKHLKIDVDSSRLQYHHFQNFQAGIASGSFLTGGMVIAPCSMGTVAAVAHGISQNLIHRSADVHLKERRKLIVVPRETPLGLVQLKNMTSLAEAGAILMPAMPGFYTLPRTIDDLVNFVVGRICDQLEVPHQLLNRWGTASEIEHE